MAQELSGLSKATKSELGENHNVCYLTKAVKMRDFSGLLDPGPKNVSCGPPHAAKIITLFATFQQYRIGVFQ